MHGAGEYPPRCADCGKFIAKRENAETRASSRQYVNEDNMKLRAENAALRSEVERLRLRPDEVEAIIVASIEANALVVHETAHSQSLRNLLARHGGGQ